MAKQAFTETAEPEEDWHRLQCPGAIVRRGQTLIRECVAVAVEGAETVEQIGGLTEQTQRVVALNVR